jgi:hypothetical protein
MEKFSLSDRYRLEIHWKSLSYERDGLCKFDGAYFSGPALQDALRLNDEGPYNVGLFSSSIYSC